ncbi:IS481 family transposase [Leifsonia sp. AG29]|uniref:IS481 family transposase n=1 Tax=Leifsonia sp. AG29 TaxID=2598860 RepID=UPI00131D6B17|nr:IS481 family transposase [Leifsonia sp. AG29]
MTRSLSASAQRAIERRANHKLAVLRHVEEVSGNIAASCRYYGVSRQAYYAWLKRCEAEGFEGLKDRSSAPHHSPTATDAEVIEKILWLRQQYHFGPEKITMYLKRYHDITISASGVWRILKKVGLNRLPASQRYKRREIRWKRYEKQRLGHALQVDVKFIEPLGQTGKKKRYYQYTAIDDCTRLRVLKAYPAHDQKTAIRFIDHVLAKLPFQVEKVQTDNGSEFGQSFHWHLLDKGIDHIRIRPATPRLNGKVERSHRIDAEEFYRLLEGQVIDDVNLFNDRLQQWEDYYNYDRPHGALAGQTPYERLKQKTQDPLS